MYKHPEIIVLEGRPCFSNWMKTRLAVHGFPAIVGKGIVRISPNGFAPQALLLQGKRQYIPFDPTKIKLAFIGHDLLQIAVSRGLLLIWLQLLGIKCINVTVCHPIEENGHQLHAELERLELISFDDYLRRDLACELKNHKPLIATTGDEYFNKQLN